MDRCCGGHLWLRPFSCFLLDKKALKNQGRHQGPTAPGDRPSPMSACPRTLPSWSLAFPHITNYLSDSKRLQATTVDYKRLFNGLVLTRAASLRHNSNIFDMAKKNPFDKEQSTKIPFSELVELIGTSCDYKFCIIDENIDEELMSLAASHGINLKGFKHVIETSGIQHAEKRHGFKSNDRVPLSLEDYLLIPFIIKNRDKVEVSAQTDISHHNTILKYTKQIGDTYYYVEEIRKRNKSLAFKSLIKREKENPSKERG